MSTLITDDKKTEFFGFYSLFEKTSTILGPLTFGLVSWLSGSERFAVLSISVFFLAGYLLLRKVEEASIHEFLLFLSYIKGNSKRELQVINLPVFYNIGIQIGGFFIVQIELVKFGRNLSVFAQ